eukprot:g13308.t1
MPPRAKTVSGKNQWLAAKGHYDNNKPPPPPAGPDNREPEAEVKPKGKRVSFAGDDSQAFPEPGHHLNPWPEPAAAPAVPQGEFVQHIATDRAREYGLGPLYPDYIGAAAEWQKEHTAEHLRRKNASITRLLLEMSEATKKANARTMKGIKPHLQQVYEGKNFEMLKLLLKVALDRWPSMQGVREQIESIVPKLLTGFRNSGSIQPCGFWKKLQHRQVRDRKLVAAAAVEKLSRSTKSPSRDHWAEEDHIEVMWRQKESMVSKGLWREVGADMDISSDVMGEKEIREQLQLRREISAASDAAVHAEEVEVEPLESFIAASSGPDAEDKVEDESYDGLKRGRDSQKAAPQVRQWQLIMSLVALFGSLSSVHECVAVSETLQFIVAAVLRVTATIYIDDVHIMSRPSVSESDGALVNLMLLLLGWWRSDNKSEAMGRMLKRALVVLGVAYEWLSRTTTIIRIDPDKVQELLLLGVAILQNKRIELKQLERYRGLFRHCLQLSRSQAAAAAIHPFKLSKFMREKQVIHAYTDAAIDDVMGCSAAIEQGVSDLSQFNMKLGGFIYINEFTQYAFAVHLTKLPKHVKKINIQVLEALAARVCIDLYSPARPGAINR